MFGYIRPFKPELKICEFQAYNAVYCGFCRALGNSGALLRFTLSYDFTFFSLLSLAVKKDFCGFDTCCCPAKLFAKKTCVKQSDELSYSAGLAVLLLHAKLKDNILDKDSSSLLSRIMLLYLKPKYKKAAKTFALEAEAVENYLKDQIDAEKSNASLDACCHPTANLLSFFFQRLGDSDEQREALKRLGYVLGRWIYLLDAADDLERDFNSSAFNPLKSLCNTKNDIESAKKECELFLNVCISEAMDSVLKIKLYHFEPIIKNIIFLGMKNTQKSALYSKTKKERKLALNGKSV